MVSTGQGGGRDHWNNYSRGTAGKGRDMAFLSRGPPAVASAFSLDSHLLSAISTNYNHSISGSLPLLCFWIQTGYSSARYSVYSLFAILRLLCCPLSLLSTIPFYICHL